MHIKFLCPECSTLMFDESDKYLTLNEIERTNCGFCGRAMTKDDIISQAMQTAQELFLDCPRHK